MNPLKLPAYASDPIAFFGDLRIRTAAGIVRFGDVMAEHQREWFQAIAPALVAVARGEKPPIGRYWWEGTKGSAKDFCAAACLLWLLAFTKRPLDCQVAAADQDQADEVHKAAREFLHENPALSARITTNNWRIVCAATSSIVDIVAADTAGSHGATPDVLILNELSHVTKQEFAENMADNASKVPHGLVLIATNAGFTGTWTWKWREIARLSDRWSFHKMDRPAPWIDAAEIEEASRRNSQSRFRRLWWGVWASGAGDAFDEADILAAIDPKLEPMGKALLDFGFAAGLDLGIKHDHAALVVVGANAHTQRLRLASCESWAPQASDGRVDLMAVEEAVYAAHQRFGPIVGYDPYQCELMAQRLRKRGVNMVEVPFVSKNLVLMSTTALEVFRSRRIDLFDDQKLVADIRRLSIVEKSYGHRLEATRDADGHADRGVGLVLSLLMAKDATPYMSEWGGVVNVDTWWRGSSRNAVGMPEAYRYPRCGFLS